MYGHLQKEKFMESQLGFEQNLIIAEMNLTIYFSQPVVSAVVLNVCLIFRRSMNFLWVMLSMPGCSHWPHKCYNCALYSCLDRRCL